MGGQRGSVEGNRRWWWWWGIVAIPKPSPPTEEEPLGLWLIQLPPDVTIRGVAQGGEAAEGGGTEGWACSVDSERSSADRPSNRLGSSNNRVCVS